MVYMDETSVNLWGVLRKRTWTDNKSLHLPYQAKRGKNLTVYGAISGFMSEAVKEPHFRFIYSVVNKTNSVNTKAFLEKVIEEVPVPIAQIKLVCDNHSSHRSNSTT